MKQFFAKVVAWDPKFKLLTADDQIHKTTGQKLTAGNILETPAHMQSSHLDADLC